MAWDPTITYSDWGRPQLVVGGVDVTFFRDVPVQIGSWSTHEPFDHASLEVSFPQITPFEPLPSWLHDFALCDLNLIRPDGSVKRLWEGLFISEDDRLSQTENSLSIQFVGALFQGDFFIMPPDINKFGTQDISVIISRELNPYLRPSLRLNPVLQYGYTGVVYGQAGSWNPLLSGYIQDMLAIATSSGLPIPGEAIIGITPTPSNNGYWMTGTLGSVLAFGDARYWGSMLGTPLNEPASRVAAHPGGQGYWFAARDGGVFTFGKGLQFWGSLGLEGNPNDIIAIESTPSGNGYWLADEIGGVFAFGDAGFFGSIPAEGDPDLVALDKVVDFARTPSGNGYWLLTLQGYVYAFGDADYFGGVNNTVSAEFVAMAARPQGDGYWLLHADGTVFHFGGGAHHGDHGAEAESMPMTDIVSSPSGNGYYIAGGDGGVFTYGDAVFYGSVPGGGGWTSQWTLMNAGNRQPELRIKNMWDNHWTVRIGTPGVEHSFSRDLKTAANVHYGQGKDLDDNLWRNTKYPNLFPDTPTMTSPTIQIGSTHPDVFVWKSAMADCGWEMYGMETLAAGLYTQTDANQCRAFQAQAGLVVTGAVDQATWDATFNPGINGNDLDSAFFMPLAIDPAVEQYFYNPRGGLIGLNPAYDPTVIRVEQPNDYGAKVTKQEGVISAQGQLARDYPARYTGTVTLSVDPAEGSRFEIRSGENITVQSHRGVDRFFHISQTDADFQSGTVTLTLDEAGRDALTLAAFRSRYRDVTDPARRASRRATAATVTADVKPMWDHENGGGRIMRHEVTAGRWSVIRVPAGESGAIIQSRFWTDVPARFVVGVFEYPIAVNELDRLGPPTVDGFWDSFLDVNNTTDDQTGTIAIAWGKDGQMGGFSPGTESEGDPLTGQLKDLASWNFESQFPPWLWVAVWCDTTTYFQGRLFPAPSASA